ncbi:MAG: tandem-95 repeat protein [Fibrobacter sp.]|nr:tandem-95 repeat protein [Fibrobacter sp.]
MNRKLKALFHTLLAFSFFAPAVFAQEAAPQPENSPPQITGIPGESVPEGKSFAVLSLDKYVEDADDKPAALRWEVTGNKNLQVTLSPERSVTVKAPNALWHGSEELTFTVTDPKGAQASEKVVFEVESVNNPPVIKTIPDQAIDEGQQFKAIKLDDFIEDADHQKSEITWETDISATNKKQADGDLSVSVDANRVATITIPDANWYGEAKITFTANDPEYASVKMQATFTVKPVNDAPVVQKAPDQEIEEKNEFEPVNLTDLVTDVDDDISKIKWTVSGGNALKVSIDKNGIATVKIPNELWNGPKETFTFTATDPEGASASFTTSFTVKSVNDVPEFISDIQDQTIDEKKTFKPIALDKIVKDIDNPFESLKWTISGNKDLKVQIEGKEARILTPNELWNGEESITFKVTDPEGAADERSATFTVNSINDLPVFTQPIPGQTINEKKSFKAIKLDDYVKDADHKKEELSWEVSVKHQGKEPETGTLDIQIDDKHVANIIIPDSLWNGSAVATFTVTDPDGASIKQDVTFTVTSVNDVPVFKKIPDQTIDEKNEFESIALDDFLSDADHNLSQLKITVTGEKELKVSVSSSREVTVKTPNELWNGSETLTFTATDPEGAKASVSAKFTVKSINDLPVMKDIPSQAIKEKQSFKTFTLDDFVSDADHEKSKLKWDVTGAKDLKVSVNSSSRLVTVTAPNTYWNGEETLTFKVTDPEGAADERTATFTVESVNDVPEFVKKPEDQTIDEKKQFAVIRLGDMVKDADHKNTELSWSFDVKPRAKSGNAQLEVRFNEKQQTAAIAIPNEYWSGSEDITFTATDPDGAKASATALFTVKSVNDAPVIKDIPDQNIQEKESFTPIALAELTNDPDHSFDKLKWTISGNKDLKVNLDKSGTASVTAPNALWNGSEKITFTVTDPESATAKKTVTFTAKSVNDVPVMKDIKEQTIKEKGTFQTIALDNFVEDPDHEKSKLKWEVAGNRNLKVTIDARHVATVSAPDKFWHGSETLTFTVTDPEGAKDSRTAAFTVESVNDAPEFVKKIGNQTIKEKAQFILIKLNELVKDADHKLSELVWSFDAKSSAKGAAGLSVKTDGENNATIVIPNTNWNGSEEITFTVTDPEGAKASTTATFTVTSVNDAPVLSKIEDQKIKEKESFPVIDLSALVKDPDHSFEKLNWTITGNKDLKVTLDKSGKVTVAAPNKLWNGSEKITFTVTDPEGASAKQTVTFTVTSVNDAPVIKEIPNQTIKEKQSFKEISLDEFVSDADHTTAQLKWNVEGAKELKVTLGSGRKVTVATPNPYWHGSEMLTFTVTDPEGAKASHQTAFTVSSVNDAPEFVKAIPNQNIDEKKTFAKINLDDFIKDPDHKKSELTWTWKAVPASDNEAPAKSSKAKKPVAEKESPLKVSIDANHVATIEIPNKFWNGSADITFTAKDPEGASVSSKARFTVKSINDLPVISANAPKDQKIKEGGKFTSIDLSTLATDADHLTSTLQWTISGNRQLKVDKQKNGMVLVSVPSAQWFGRETLTFTVTDPEGGKATHSVTFEAEEVNDAPVIGKIPNQKIKEKAKFNAVKLDDFVKDPDNKPSELVWTVSGAKKLNAQISPSRQLTVTAPSATYNGPAEVLTLMVKDPKGAFASTTVSFEITSVNDAPVMKDIPNQKIKEKQTFKEIQLNNFVNDPDHKKEDLKWTAVVSKVPEAAPKKPAKKPAPKKKSGKKNDEPVVENPDLKVLIDAGNVARFSLPSPSWNGERQITFTVTDPEGAKDSRTVLFTVESVNDIPVIKTIEGQTIKEKEKFKPIDLSALVSDPDHPLSAITLTVSGNKQLKAVIDAKKVLTVSAADKFWSGEERLTITATDPEGAKAAKQVLFKVTPVNDPPVIKGLSGQKIREKEKFQPVDLSKVATDPDNKPNELKWSVSGAKELKAVQQGNRVNISTPNINWFGKETLTFTVTDPAGASASQKVTFEAAPVNDPPEFTNISAQTVKEKEKFAAIHLSQYVKDPDHKFGELVWTLDNAELPGKNKRGKPTKGKAATTKHALHFEITEDGILNINIPNRNWNGRDSITVTAHDPAGAKASETIQFMVTPVNDAPEVKPIEGQSVDQGKPFKVIKLDQYVKDPDNKVQEIKWTVSGNRNLDVVISPNREATIKNKRDIWHGKETLIFTATDPARASGKATAVFEVRRVNAPPEIRKIPDYTIKEDENKGVIAVIQLDQIARDRDHRFDLLKWSFSGNRNLTLKHDMVKNTVTISQPYENWNGPAESITFKVTDPEGASVQTTAKFTVIPVNDAPKAMSHNYQTREGETLAVSAENGLLQGVIDPDGEKVTEVEMVRKPQNGTANINTRTGAFTYTPNRGFNGLDEFSFRVKDPGGLYSNPVSAEINVSFKMKDVRGGSAPAPAEKSVQKAEPVKTKAAPVKKNARKRR